MKMKSTEFRKELIKIMPGYKWTVHRNLLKDSKFMEATGIKTVGFNRLSTLNVVRSDKEGYVWYDVKSSGFGKKAPWLGKCGNTTLARALRDLQDYYDKKAQQYSSHASDIEYARKKYNQPSEHVA